MTTREIVCDEYAIIHRRFYTLDWTSPRAYFCQWVIDLLNENRLIRAGSIHEEYDYDTKDHFIDVYIRATNKMSLNIPSIGEAVEKRLD